MDREKKEELINLFPKLYEYLDYGFECGNGWFDLIKELSEQLMPLIEAEPCDEDFFMYVEQVKEKYGGLRFYMTFSTKKMSELISQAEDKSYEICEVCGKPGKLNKGPWYQVRCQECK